MAPDKKAIVQLVELHKTVFRKKFHIYIQEQFQVFVEFCKLADKLWERGRRHYSSRTIGEKIRFDSDVSEVGSTFKLNDHSTPDLGRLYVLLHPERLDLFSYRRGHFRLYVVELLEEQRSIKE